MHCAVSSANLRPRVGARRVTEPTAKFSCEMRVVAKAAVVSDGRLSARLCSTTSGVPEAWSVRGRGAQQRASLPRTHHEGVEGVPDIPLFRKNTAAFVHEMREGALSNVDGDTNYVCIHVTTNPGSLAQREKQIAVVRQLTDLASRAADDPTLPDRTWVILTEAIAGGWACEDMPVRMTSWWGLREPKSPSSRAKRNPLNAALPSVDWP